MSAIRSICIGILLFTITLDASAKKISLKCSRGYRVDITFKVWYPTDPASFRAFTMSCPPTAKITIPDGYNGISVDPGAGTMTAPDGTQTDLQIPSPIDNSPRGSDLGVAPWPPLPPYRSYIGTSRHWTEDPLAPPFIQDGEILLGEFDDGATFPFTLRALDSAAQTGINGATVTILDPSGTNINSDITDNQGRLTVNLRAGETYRIKIDAPGYLSQVSDEFMVFGTHMWTMVMTPSVPSNNFSLWTWGLIIVIVLLLIRMIATRRTRIP